MSKPTAAILFTLLFSWIALAQPYVAAADELLEKYQAVCHAHMQMASTETRLARFRYDAVMDMHQQGFASWKEMSAGRIAFESASINHRALEEFSRFVDSVAAEANARGVNPDAASLTTAGLFLPNSRRMVGWVHNPQLENDQKDEDFAALKEDLQRCETEFANAEQSLLHSSDNPEIQRRMELRHAHCRAQLDYSIARIGYAQSLNSNESATVGSAMSYQTVRPEQDAEFLSLVKAVAELEADSQSEIESLRLQSEMEQRRYLAFRELVATGAASENEVRDSKRVVDRMEEQLRMLRQSKSVMIQAVEQIGGDATTRTDIDRIAAGDYETVSGWPDAVFEDRNLMHYLIQQRRSGYLSEANAKIAALELQWTGEIVTRLADAAARTSTRFQNDRFGRLLASGQQNELDSYRMKQKILDVEVSAMKEEVAILKLEERRFLKQSVLMAAAEQESNAGQISADVRTYLPLLFQPQMLNVMLWAPGTAAEPKAMPETSSESMSFGYLESAFLNGPQSKSDLVLHRNVGLPVGGPSGNYGSRPLLLTRYSPIGASSLSPLSLRSGASTGTTSRYKLLSSRSYGSTLRSYSSLSATRLYQPGSSFRTIQRAYPFGILRNDLRRFTNAGQPPWFFPGSPNNLRYNQLRTRRTNQFGVSGNQILKSQYLFDLSGSRSQGH